MTSKHIVVIGAGYAGLSAATRAGRGGARVTLVSPDARLVHRIRLHETAAGREVPTPAIAHVLRGRPVTHLQAKVTELDLAGRKVFTDTGETLTYDTLVYALGSRTAWQDVPGAAEHAYSAERAVELDRRIQDAPAPGTVAVVGGGATGIEVAAELAEAHPDWQVRIVAAGAVGGLYSERGRAHVHRVLKGLGVAFHEHTTVTAVTADGLETAAGPVPADLVVWAASLRAHPLAAEAGLATTPDGRALVDDHLRSVSHPEVHVVGDAAAVDVPGIGLLRMGCATAQPMGAYVGKLLGGRTDKAFRYRYISQCISLGRREAMVQLIHADDSMRPRVITGGPGRLVKAAIVTSVPLALR